MWIFCFEESVEHKLLLDVSLPQQQDINDGFDNRIMELEKFQRTEAKERRLFEVKNRTYFFLWRFLHSRFSLASLFRHLHTFF